MLRQAEIHTQHKQAGRMHTFIKGFVSSVVVVVVVLGEMEMSGLGFMLHKIHHEHEHDRVRVPSINSSRV